ncbi:MAG TPA: cytochrome d ubiquinol oxidase subunit II [Vicinamibacteria bacterium]|nr:cytochrome d ubiquinol oxidase subunit II [Vicinamibacteria bacterium]
MINDAWFVALAAMLTGYAVLDGFDLGTGVLHLLVGRSQRERATLIDAIGPVWNGNEVWLLAAGGSLVVAFPRVYATGFSGFYLALMLVLWLLLGRGLAIEFRHQVDSELWRDAWDVVFAGASTLLAVLFGVAVGNVLHGLPLDANGEFLGSFALLLNPFSILCGVLSLAVLALHGAAWLALKTTAAVQQRARRWARGLFWAVAALLAAVVAASFAVRPDFTANFGRWPVLLLLPLFGLTSLALLRLWQVREDDRRAFLAGCALIATVLGSVAAGIYPMLLPARPGSAHPGLDVFNSASPASSLRIAMDVYLFGMALVITYTVNVYRVWRGKVSEPTYH